MNGYTGLETYFHSSENVLLLDLGRNFIYGFFSVKQSCTLYFLFISACLLFAK